MAALPQRQHQPTGQGQTWIGTQAAQAAQWAQQYSTGSNSEGAEKPENPEWETARQALASIHKASSSASSAATAGTGGQSTAQSAAYLPQTSDCVSVQQYYQQWYQQYNYTYPYQYYSPYQGVYPGYQGQYSLQGSYTATQVQQSSQHGQPPVPGLEEAVPCPSAQAQDPTTQQGPKQGSPAQVVKPQHQAPSGGKAQGPQVCCPSEGGKARKGQRLWQRMKQAPGSGTVKFHIQARPYGVGLADGEQKGHRFSESASPTRPDNWPQAMKEYVQRCFTACETELDKDPH
ncbi:leukocyte receptor cluster member 8-like isoform X2 [Narcine bancroftii]|uniref:leukocyte receptor cluster member 8-like isoform X2 n=1 Tax=Narcine bancroftii TaxID=1343680 RepID=UPI00383125A5